ncbi:multidrug effflux MFS transporter [Candidatus Tisiphia endosymbiont of Micropterix aruncella]|uniref:multidrug effflux MFS transporter n=1 Tax=Candidatus Tisiphia endosymbiont of Micropterix aruncella TaxID=3066271 RepID=UPI003AA89B64
MKLDKIENIIVAPLYIIILMVIIPTLSETIYTPSLPDLAKDLKISANLAEYTLTIFLFGFAVGVLIWGNLSDFYGRKPCILTGFLIYTLSCFICYLADNINMLLAARFMQAFGASVGSVLGQAIARDIIKPAERGKMFSTIAIAIAFAPAIGPIIGGFVIKFYHWSAVFLVLIVIAIFIMVLISARLPETNLNLRTERLVIPLYKECFGKMIKDPRLLGLAFLTGAVNGILFGYFTEAPFYFISGLNILTSSFGMISFFICIPLALGGLISKKMHKLQKTSDNIIFAAIKVMCLGSLLFLLSSYFNLINKDNVTGSLLQTLLWLGIIMTGITMIAPNCLSQALEDYGKFAGTAASLFGFMYYIIVTSFTALMGYMHNGSLTQLPLFMLIISISMMLVFHIVINKQQMAKNNSPFL